MPYVSLNRPSESKRGEWVYSDLEMEKEIFPGAPTSFWNSAQRVIKDLQVPYLIAHVLFEGGEEAFYDGLYAIHDFTESTSSKKKLVDTVYKIHYFALTEVFSSQMQGQYIGEHGEITANPSSFDVLDLIQHTYREQPSLRDLFFTAERFDKGQGCAINPFLARTYYNLAAEKGHEESQFRVAWMFLLSEGGPRNEKLAKKYFKMVVDAEQSEEYQGGYGKRREERVSTCAYQLAKMYRDSKEWGKASKYYQIAGQFDMEAKYDCAQMLMEKEGPMTDEERILVLRFLEEVAEHEDQSADSAKASFVKVEAQYSLASKLHLLIKKLPLGKQSWEEVHQQWEKEGLDWEEVLKAWRNARKYYERASSHGHLEAKVELAYLLFYPIEGERDRLKIKDLLVQAAEQGHAKAKFQLFLWRNSLLLSDSFSGSDKAYPYEKSPEEYLRDAADQGMPEAQYEWAKWLEQSGRQTTEEDQGGDRLSELVAAISYYERAIDTWRRTSSNLSTVRVTQVHLDQLILTVQNYGSVLRLALQKQVDQSLQTSITYSTKKNGFPQVSIKLEEDKKVFRCEIEGSLRKDEEEDLFESMISCGALKMLIYKEGRLYERYASFDAEVMYAEKDLQGTDAGKAVCRLQEIVLLQTSSEELVSKILSILMDCLCKSSDPFVQRQVLCAYRSLFKGGLSPEHMEKVVFSLSDFLRSGANTQEVKRECVCVLTEVCCGSIAVELRTKIIGDLSQFLSEDEEVYEEVIASLTILATGRIGASNYGVVVKKLMDVMLNGRKMVDPIAEALGEIAFNTRAGTPGPAIVKTIKQHLVTFARQYEKTGCISRFRNNTIPRQTLRKLGYNHGKTEFIIALKTGVNLALQVAQKVPL